MKRLAGLPWDLDESPGHWARRLQKPTAVARSPGFKVSYSLSLGELGCQLVSATVRWGHDSDPSGALGGPERNACKCFALSRSSERLIRGTVITTPASESCPGASRQWPGRRQPAGLGQERTGHGPLLSRFFHSQQLLFLSDGT